MPYKNNEYKNFIRSSRWKKLRAEQLKREPLCRFCKSVGRYTQATQVDHIQPCFDDPILQQDPNNLRSLCAPCHAPLRGNYRRGYSTAVDVDGYPTDPNHPARR
jgi:5-methylcytosine-specific restriction protein A